MVTGQISYAPFVGTVVLIGGVEHLSDLLLRFFFILTNVTESLIIAILHNFSVPLLYLSLKLYHI